MHENANTQQTQQTAHHATEIVKGLYLSPVPTTLTLQQLEITHVISLTPFTPPRHISQLKIFARDEKEFQIWIMFDTAYRFIREALNNGEGKVLVHCAKGISRSVTIIIMYLMRSLKMTHIEAHNLVRTLSPSACPNRGFMQQLAIHGQRTKEMNMHCLKCSATIGPFRLLGTHAWTYICSFYFLDGHSEALLSGDDLTRYQATDVDLSGSIQCAGCSDVLGRWYNRSSFRCLCKVEVCRPIGLYARKLRLALPESA